MLTLDHVFRSWVVAHRVEVLTTPLWLMSVVGRGGMIWIGLAAVIAIRQRRRAAFTAVLLALLLGSAVANEILKPMVHRARPFETLPGAVIGGRPPDPSFPSGHSANAFSAATVLSRVAPTGAIVWWGLATLIAFSRVYLGVHYPLDVIGGAAVGVACGWLAIWLTRFSKL